MGPAPMTLTCPPLSACMYCARTHTHIRARALSLSLVHVGSDELTAHVVSVRHGLRALPGLIYADKHVRASLIMSLLPESYTDTLSALLAHVIHPSPAVCSEVAALWALQEDSGMHGGGGSWCGRSGVRIMGEGAGDGGRGEPGSDARRGEHVRLLEGWYVGVHIRVSGWWDPSGSSPGGARRL